MQIFNHFDTSLEHLFDIFLTSCKAKGLSNKTLISYKGGLERITAFLDKGIRIENLSAEMIDSVINEMRNKNLSPNTIQSYVRTFRVFINWCRERGYSDLTIKPYKGVETIKETYSDEELLLLLKRPDIRKCTFQEYRN